MGGEWSVKDLIRFKAFLSADNNLGRKLVTTSLLIIFIDSLKVTPIASLVAGFNFSSCDSHNKLKLVSKVVSNLNEYLRFAKTKLVQEPSPNN